jgi:L-fucose isomerase-like protein
MIKLAEEGKKSEETDEPEEPEIDAEELIKQLQQDEIDSQELHDAAPWYSRWFRTQRSFMTPEAKARHKKAVQRAKKLYSLVRKHRRGFLGGRFSPEGQKLYGQADSILRAMGRPTADQLQAMAGFAMMM